MDCMERVEATGWMWREGNLTAKIDSPQRKLLYCCGDHKCRHCTILPWKPQGIKGKICHCPFLIMSLSFFFNWEWCFCSHEEPLHCWTYTMKLSKPSLRIPDIGGHIFYQILNTMSVWGKQCYPHYKPGGTTLAQRAHSNLRMGFSDEFCPGLLRWLSSKLLTLIISG